MQLNRELQLCILTELTTKFPDAPNGEVFKTLCDLHGYEEVIGNILYLEMHNLISVKAIRTMGSGAVPNVHWALCKPTEKAFDFLAEDGGLSAILGVVTVKLHADTIRDMLQMRIMDSQNLTAEEKASWVEKLKTLSEASLEHLTLKGLDYALDHGGEGISWLGKLLGF